MKQSIMGTAFLLSVLLGCAPPEPPPLAGARFVFVPRLGGNPDLWVFKVDPQTAALAPVAGSPFKLGVEADTVTAHPRGRFVYLQVGLGNKTVAGVAIDPVTGIPSTIPGSPFPLEGGTRLILSPSDGRFMYAADGGGRGTPGFAVDATTGGLMPLLGSPFGTFHTTPFGGRTADLWLDGLVFHPSGEALFGYAGSQFLRYAINPVTGILGDLRKVGDLPLASGPFILLAIDPSGRFLFNARGARIWAYSIDATTGQLVPVPGSPFSQGANTTVTQLVIPPQGQFLYAVNAPFPSREDLSSIWGFTIDPTSGALVPIPGSPFLQGQTVTSGQGSDRTLAVDSLGKVLYAAACRSVFVLRIDDSGALAHVPGSPFVTPWEFCADELDASPQ